MLIKGEVWNGLVFQALVLWSYRRSGVVVWGSDDGVG
jgi:hypothetical protein